MATVAMRTSQQRGLHDSGLIIMVDARAHESQMCTITSWWHLMLLGDETLTHLADSICAGKPYPQIAACHIGQQHSIWAGPAPSAAHAAMRAARC